MDRNFNNKAVFSSNPVTGEKNVRWKVVGGHLYPFGTSNINPIGGVILNTDVGKNFIFSLEHINKKDYITFYFFKNEIYLKVGDFVRFKFDNNEIIEFKILRPSSKSDSSWPGMYTNRAVIDKREINHFENNKMIVWEVLDRNRYSQLSSKTKNFYWYTGEQIFDVIKNLAFEYIQVLGQELPDHRIFERMAGDIDRINGCFVYLMIDTSNNFYKIGISNKPQYREKTLQSEKPTIELICAKKYPKRVMAEAIESSLHKVYNSKRIRGEWFELDEEDVNDIKTMLQA